MYLPVTDAEAEGGVAPVMFGAVRLYLIDKFPSLKRLPEKSLRFLDRRKILDMAASFASSTRAGGHEEMTISMLEGGDGPFADEFGKSAESLLKLKPDLIFLSNAFLLGVGEAVKAISPVPIACLLQDEHVWVDAAAQNYRGKTWKAIADKCRYADALYTFSDWFKEKIAALLSLPSGIISTIPLGVDPARYAASTISSTPSSSQAIHAASTTSSTSAASIGYISRLCGDMGMDVLTNAYCQLLNKRACNDAPTLDFCGGYTKDDMPIIKKSRKAVSQSGGRMNIRKNFGIGDRAAFLSSQSILAVPAQVNIAFGAFIAEAMAAGVPVVQPDEGGFSEIISETKAGLLYSPNTPEALADALEKALLDDDSRKSMAEAGRRAVLEKYNNVETARRALAFLNDKAIVKDP
jgi:glycosyltransferase involved in cell wall biosynthesis